MFNLGHLLRQKSFWRFYFNTNDESRNDAILECFQKASYDIVEHGGLTLTLPCPDDAKLEIRISQDPNAVISLSLVDQSGASEMAWWDDQQFHPLALRWYELTSLFRFWRTQPDMEIEPHVGFLLLTIFVGNVVDEEDQYESRQETIQRHLATVGCFKAKEVKKIAEQVLIVPPDDDYQWRRHSDLGWTLSGEYPCYSLRNMEHLDSDDGKFPFDRWNAVVESL